MLRAARAGSDLALSLTGGSASGWRFYRDAAKTAAGSTALAPDATVRAYLDRGALLEAGDAYYVVRGLSCAGQPGP